MIPICFALTFCSFSVALCAVLVESVLDGVGWPVFRCQVPVAAICGSSTGTWVHFFALNAEVLSALSRDWNVGPPDPASAGSGSVPPVCRCGTGGSMGILDG